MALLELRWQNQITRLCCLNRMLPVLDGQAVLACMHRPTGCDDSGLRHLYTSRDV
jgi:hypothetical protein